MYIHDTIIIGGGQAGLSVAYYLRRFPIDFLILDNQKEAGGSWLHTWDSLKLFSPVQYSSLSGWMMPRGEHDYPTKDAFITYLNQYEQRYDFPIQRPVSVHHVVKEEDVFVIQTDRQTYFSKTLVSATGTAQTPYIPTYRHMDMFTGQQIHSVDYLRPQAFAGQQVLIVGGGNSGAQILADVSKVAETQWVTLAPPEFLPDEVDGRYLFHQATAAFLGKPTVNTSPKLSLGNIVMLDSVKEARSRGVLTARRPFQAFYEDGVVWEDGSKQPFDAVIWCTGFQATLNHLQSLGVVEDHRIQTDHTRSRKEPNLWLVGYGDWTGFASATIYGVGKTARATAQEIEQTLRQ